MTDPDALQTNQHSLSWLVRVQHRDSLPMPAGWFGESPDSTQHDLRSTQVRKGKGIMSLYHEDPTVVARYIKGVPIPIDKPGQPTDPILWQYGPEHVASTFGYQPFALDVWRVGAAKGQPETANLVETHYFRYVEDRDAWVNEHTVNPLLSKRQQQRHRYYSCTFTPRTDLAHAVEQYGEALREREGRAGEGAIHVTKAGRIIRALPVKVAS